MRPPHNPTAIRDPNAISEMPRFSVENDFIEELINEFRTHECLWNIRSRHHKDKARRDESYESLRRIALRHFGPKIATKSYVVLKIKNLRTAYKKELNKVQLAKKCDRNYVPKLWYFSLMEFLRNEEEGRACTCMAKDDENADFENYEEIEEEETKPMINPDFHVEDTSITMENKSPTPSRSPTPTPSHSSNLKKKYPARPLYKPKNEDEFDVAGKDYANKLRSLDSEQRIIAEKLVSDIIFAGKLKRLKLSAKIDEC